MKWVKWAWPIAGLLALARYYLVSALTERFPKHIHVDGHTYGFWPHGRFGVVVQVFTYVSLVGITTLVVIGAAVAAFLYVRQNRRPPRNSAQRETTAPPAKFDRP